LLIEVKIKSTHQKGSSFERKIVKDLISSGLDKYARRSIMSGAVFEDGDIKTSLPFVFECKKQEKISLYKWWNQAKFENRSGGRKKSVLIFKSNNKDTLAIMDWNDWLEIVTPFIGARSK